MVRLFGQHELGGACQGIETGLGQRAQLELAIAIREIRKHVERQPVGGFLVERAQYAVAVLVARITLQQGIGLFTAVAPEIAVQQKANAPKDRKSGASGT